MQQAILDYGIPAGLIIAFLVFKRMGQISGDKARELIQAGAVLVDVRSAAEFSSGHIPGARNVPVQEVGSKAESLGPKTTPVVVYCASGTRSAMARSALKAKGFQQVFNLGSMGRW